MAKTLQRVHLFIADTSLQRTPFLRTNGVRYREVLLYTSLNLMKYTLKGLFKLSVILSFRFYLLIESYLFQGIVLLFLLQRFHLPELFVISLVPYIYIYINQVYTSIWLLKWSVLESSFYFTVLDQQASISQMNQVVSKMFYFS